MQKASVEPNELQKESRYIQRNIDATRRAFGLENVAVKDFDYKEDLNAAAEEWHKVVELAPDTPEGQAARRALEGVASAHAGETTATP